MPQYNFGQVIPVTGPNIGFQGTVSRFGERVIAARQFVPYSSTNVLNFGDPAVIIQNGAGGYYDSVADFVANAVSNIALLPTAWAGMAVREVKTMLTYPAGQQPGLQQVGYYSSGQMSEVLERGSGTVLVSVSNSPTAEAQVYTRIVANTAVPAGFVGDWEIGAPAATDLFTNATTLTEGSASATVTSGTNIKVGQLISGPGIATGTYVAAISGTALTLSQAATATFATTGSLLTFSNLFACPNVVARTGYVDANSMLEITLKVRQAA